MNQNMKRMADIVLWSMTSVVLILTAITILVKLMLPYVDEYRHQIERNLSQISGYHIQIENISAKLEGLDPSFTILGVSLSAEGEVQPLRFERLMIRFNLWESLKELQLKFSYIRFYQTKLSLSHLAGRWSLTGLPLVAAENTGGFVRIFNYFLDQRQISLVDTSVKVVSDRIGSFDLSSKAMYLQRTDAGIGITANVHHQNYDDEFKFNAEILGDLSDPSAIKVVAELDLPAVSITSTELAELEELRLAQLDIGAKLWLSYSALSDLSLVGNLDLTPKFISGEILKLKANLNSRYSLENKKLSLQLSDLVVAKSGKTYPAANLDVESDFNHQSTDVRFDSLDLSLGVELALPYLNDAWFVTGMLEAMKPQGEAQNGHLKIVTSPVLSVSYLGNLAIKSSQGYRNIPSVEGLDAVLEINDTNGSIGFASNNAKLAFPLLYSDIWQIAGIAGEVEWGRVQDTFLVTANDLYLNRNGSDLEGDFRLEVVKDSTDTLALDIHADNLMVQDGLAYIPQDALPQSAQGWLKQALLGGVAKSADFTLQGELVESAKPQVLLNLDVEDAVVKFASDWPAAKQIDTRVLLDSTGVNLNLNYAEIDEVDARELTLFLPFSVDGLNELRLEGRVQNDIKDIMNLLAQTDLALSVLKPFQSWQAKGPVEGAFKLVLPLTTTKEVQPYFNLDLQLVDTELKINDLNLSGKVLDGQLYYDTEKGVYNSSFNIEAFSGLVKLDLFGDVLASNDLLISANIEGDLDLKEVMLWQKLPTILTKAVQGKVDFKAGFVIDPKLAGKVSINAETSLEGASLALPVPFSKTANTLKPLFVSIDLLPDQADVAIKYDTNYRSKLRFTASGFYGGQALINEPDDVPLAIGEGLAIQGQISHIELASWRKFLNEPSEVDSPQGLRLEVPEWLSFVRLISDQARLNEDNLLHNVKVDYDRKKAVNDIYLNSEEMSLQLTKDLQGPVVNFSYLSWSSLAEELVSGIGVDSADDSSIDRMKSDVIRAQQIPTMTLNIDELIINTKPYGDWHLQLTNLGKKIRIDPIATQLDKGKFTGSLVWQDDEHSNVELLLSIDGKNIDELTRKFSQEALLTSESYKIDVNLSWLGTPFDIQRDTLSGRIEFDAKKGVLEKINELPSFLKALGIFNIHALARRLTLDFSDVSSDGLTYDKVSTLLAINDGQLSTTNPLEIVSPTVEIELKGQANLVTETLDERLVASFPLGNALPIAGLLLGMPQVAGILYITDKIFGDQLSKVTSVEYLIKGSFSDPIITPVVHTPKRQPKDRDK